MRPPNTARRLARLAALAWAVGCGGNPGPGTQPAPAAQSPTGQVSSATLDVDADCDPLVVVSYNIRFDNPEDGDHVWGNRRHHLLKQVEQLAPDVLGVQEALHHQLAYLRSGLSGYRLEGVGRDGGEAGEYAAILYRESRFERLDGGTFWLSPTPDRPRSPDEEKPWGTHLNRVATWVELRDVRSAARLLFVNVHFDHVSERARLESARMIRSFTSDRRSSVDAVVVLGDFNARTGSAPYDLLDGRARSPEPHLVDVRHVADRLVEPSRNTTVTSWTALVDDLYIDHLFVTPELRVLEHAAIEQTLEYRGAQRFPSDHLPLRAELCP